MKKGKEKKEGNYIKKGGKGLKNASFWANLKKNRGGSSDPSARELGKKNEKGERKKEENYIKKVKRP